MQNIIKKTSKFVKRTSKKAGMSPGTLVHVGEQKIDKPGIILINYDPDRFEEKELKRIEESFEYIDTPPITWINIDGLHEVEIIEKIGEKIEQFEEKVQSEPTPEILQNIHDLKRAIIYFRRQVWPVREVLSTWAKDRICFGAGCQ
jgi:hypothetical protein